MHHLLIPHISRQDCIDNQSSLSYRMYIHWFLKQVKIAQSNYIEKHWTTRTEANYIQIKQYVALVDAIESEIKGFQDIDKKGEG